MVKIVPILGTLVLLGAILQVFLGFQVASDVESLRGLHMLLGLVGLVLVIALAAISFKAKTSTLYSRIVIAILAIIVLLQVFLGFQLLNGAESLATSHEANAIIIVLLALMMGGLTSMAARKQHTQSTQA
jgi:lysylphosphatidylglycerol synthetase-like protein (DUF2156 family)